MDDAKSIIIHQPGSMVAIGCVNNPIPARVLQVNINENGATYEVAWWDGRNRSEAWFQPCEIIDCCEDDSIHIGFHGQ